MKINYSPHPKQKIIHQAMWPPDRGVAVMVIAGRRFGKTVLAVNEIIRYAVELPGARIWYVAPTEKQAFRIAWRMMLRPRRCPKTQRLVPPYLPPDLIEKKREDQHYIEMKNGSLIEFLGTTDEISLLGSGLQLVVFDEFPGIPYSAWVDTIQPMLLDTNGNALFIGTVPDPKEHDISIQFIEMYEHAMALSGQGSIKAFNFTTFDNPYIQKRVIQNKVRELKRKGRKSDAERLYYGRYTREFGMAFPKFNYDVHTCEPYELPSGIFRVMALDPHPHKPDFGLWCAIDKDGTHIFYREKEFVDFDGRKRTEHEVGYDILTVENLHRETIRGGCRLIDPTYAKVRRMVETKGKPREVDVIDLLRDCGLFFKIGNRDNMLFYARFTDMLVEIPEPKIRIFRSCPNLIRQIQNTTWDSWVSKKARREKGARDKFKSGDDDYRDCMKYIINENYRPINKEALVSHRENLNRRWERMTNF